VTTSLSYSSSFFFLFFFVFFLFSFLICFLFVSALGRVCSAHGECVYNDIEGGNSAAATGTAAATSGAGTSAGLQCVCEYGYYGPACEATGYLAAMAYHSGYSSAIVTTSMILAVFFLLVLLVRSY
jgi:hypothetical protein